MQHHIILRVMIRILIPLILLFALYVQFHGDYGPGGGFQAGVIFAVGFILYGLIYGVHTLNQVVSMVVLTRLAAFGLLLYIGVGVLGILNGSQFLDYDVLAQTKVAGQHLGILLIELGIGIVVSAIMIILFCAFADPSD